VDGAAVTFQDQTILHVDGQTGNCFQAAIANVIGWPIERVPHFALMGKEHWWDCAQAWLDWQGFHIEYKPDSYPNLLPHCILSGQSPRGLSHSVVGDTRTGEMLHDPHPSRAGLLQVDFRLYFFRKARP
jgi:hypothetical protein